MSVELYWDDDARTTMLLEFEGRWTWEQLFEQLAVAKQVGDKADYVIGAIVNISDGVSLPGGSLLNPTNFENAKKLLEMGSSGTGPIVIAGDNRMLRTAYNTMARLNASAVENIFFASSLEGARRLLRERLPEHIPA